MREWLSGRASPCQGERREFESRLPLHNKENQPIGLVFLFYELRDEMRTSRVRRSSRKRASAFAVCEVRSTNNLLGTARSGQQIGERTVSRLPLQQKELIHLG